MIGLLQRVTHASVVVNGETIGAIDNGLLVLIGVQRGDSPKQAQRLLQRLLAYRIFPDADGRMNLSLNDTGGGLLLVPQFTLAADTQKGNRPSFGSAADPALAAGLFSELVALATQQHAEVATGEFGADMQVSLCNTGPVTFWLEVPPDKQQPG